jgi:uncharacterized C2H2 Zn-finger protein
MSIHNSLLGACPRCEHSIAPSSLLIEYETADGSTKKFADCPVCDTVVRPQALE